jgi:hypothetical protein
MAKSDDKPVKMQRKANLFNNGLVVHIQFIPVIGGGSRRALSSFLRCTPSRNEMGLRKFFKDDVGTCVKMGCIKKKLLHYAGLLGESKENLHDTV